jgi:hypothetical protein
MVCMTTGGGGGFPRESPSARCRRSPGPRATGTLAGWSKPRFLSAAGPVSARSLLRPVSRGPESGPANPGPLLSSELQAPPVKSESPVHRRFGELEACDPGLSQTLTREIRVPGDPSHGHSGTRMEDSDSELRGGRTVPGRADGDSDVPLRAVHLNRCGSCERTLQKGAAGTSGAPNRPS